MTRLVLASRNEHKVDELRAMVEQAGLSHEVVGMATLADAPELPEPEDTFAGNALSKAHALASWLREQGEPEAWVLADDSGVCVDALDGGPGVYSARFAGPDATDEDNNTKLVETLQALGKSSSPAHYTCVLALVHTAEPIGARLFAGRWDVEARIERRGTGGFGYDPHCWIDAGAGTVAELDRDTKAGASHRGQATRKLLAYLGSR